MTHTIGARKIGSPSPRIRGCTASSMQCLSGVDRSKLDALLAAAHAAHAELDAIDSSVSPEWIAAHRKASELYREVNAERSRLWKLAPWGSWMTPHDRELARISMRL